VSTNFCKIDTRIGTAGSVAIDTQGRVYVASASGLSVLRYLPPFPTGPDAAGGCGRTDASGSPVADVVSREVFLAPAGFSAFTGLAFAPNGNLYVASVLSGEIGEYDGNGELVRMILAPGGMFPPFPTGTPQSLAVDARGTLYYADIDLVGEFPDLGPGPNGKVRRITFDEANRPRAPEIIREGLAFPDGVAVLPGEDDCLFDRLGGPTLGCLNAGDVELLSADLARTIPKRRLASRLQRCLQREVGGIERAGADPANVRKALGRLARADRWLRKLTTKLTRQVERGTDGVAALLERVGRVRDGLAGAVDGLAAGS
jgi:hypothetical protein